MVGVAHREVDEVEEVSNGNIFFCLPTNLVATVATKHVRFGDKSSHRNRVDSSTLLVFKTETNLADTLVAPYGSFATAILVKLSRINDDSSSLAIVQVPVQQLTAKHQPTREQQRITCVTESIHHTLLTKLPITRARETLLCRYFSTHHYGVPELSILWECIVRCESGYQNREVEWMR